MQAKVLVVIPSFSLGGINTSLLNFLDLYNKAEIKLDVFAMSHQGALQLQYDKHLLLPENIILSALTGSIYREKNRKRKIISFTIKLIRYCLDFLRIRIIPSLYKSIAKELAKEKYDTIIAYAEGPATYFVSFFDNVKLIAWVHCDMKYLLQSAASIEFERRIYSKYYKIVCVSNFTKSEFANLFPTLNSNIIHVYNLLNTSKLKEKAEINTSLDERFQNTLFTIVSVGKVVPVKRFSSIPSIVKKLIGRGLIFRWYIIGGGNDFKEISLLEKNILNNNVEDAVCYLGEKENPFPYMKKSSLLVSTSISEAAPMVINEAKILGIPIVSTDFGSAKEYITDGFDGYITQFERIDEIIEILITNENIYNIMKANLTNYQYDNKSNLDIINRLLKENLE